MVNIVCTRSDTPQSAVYRQLDDVPVVAPGGTGRAERFSREYTAVCRDLNIPMAEECSLREKAFGPGTSGTVLGVKFDSTTMTWS